MRRRRFLKAALGGIVGVCLPLPAHPRAEPPLSSGLIRTPLGYAPVFTEVQTLWVAGSHARRTNEKVGLIWEKYYKR